MKRGKRVRPEVRARNRERSDNWVIQRDEFHPDPKIAALYADVKANRWVQGWLHEQLRRFSALTRPTREDEVKQAEVKQQLTEAIAEQARLEELATT